MDLEARWQQAGRRVAAILDDHALGARRRMVDELSADQRDVRGPVMERVGRRVKAD